MSSAGLLADACAISSRKEEGQMVIDGRAAGFLSSVELSPQEAGYLADGAPRAIGATLVGLAAMGLIDFRTGDSVVPLNPAPAVLEDPIERSVLDFLSQAERPSSVQDIRKHAEPDTE